MKLFTAMLLTVVVCTAGRAGAHGTEGWLEEGCGIRLVARYDDGEPMRHARVSIACRDESGENTIIFQTGYTDRKGRFLFIPEDNGKYRVTVQDEMGHQLVLGKMVDATETGAAQSSSTGMTTRDRRTSDKAMGVIAGIATIFGLGGLLYGRHQKKLCSREVTDGLQRGA